VRNDLRNPSMPLLVQADGESLLILAPRLGQYLKLAAPDSSGLSPGLDAQFAGLVRPLGSVSQIPGGATGVSDLGSDTVLTATGPVSCRRLQIAYAKDGTRPGLTLHPRVLWIDSERLVLRRDSLMVDMNAQGGWTSSVQVTRYVDADMDNGGPDSLYALAAPEGLARVAALGPAPPPPPAIVGKPAMDFTLTGLLGSKVTLSALRGKVVVLDFWATWCGPCRRWMPVVAKLEKELRGRDVRFYAVNERDPAAKVRDFRASTGLTIPMLLDPDGTVGDAYGANLIPLTVIVGKDGVVVKALVGANTEQGLRDALKAAGVAGI